ncbi:MAG: DNA-3-methyladenine glycosylase [bacterium]|nr:DNA-3-methyladenine glycosylase [bacterium]
MNKKVVEVLGNDPVLKKILKKDLEFEFKVSKNLYEAIVSAIIGQQLSGKAATAIENKFRKLFEGKSFPKPSEVLKTPNEKLRNCGLSWQKVKYIKNLSQAVVDKTLDINELKNLADEKVIEELIKIKGVGKWTAEMILIFDLAREDVFSVGDLGLRTAVAKLYNVDRNDLKKIEQISQNWQPYRSYASRLLWFEKDPKATLLLRTKN